MKRVLLKCAVQTQAYRATRRWYSGRLIILVYHGLTDRKAAAGIENCQGKHLYVETFRHHLEYLRRHYHVISLEGAVEHYQRGTRFPPRSVVLTFDDGYRSIHSLAWPLLREYQAPASAFLATDFVSGRDWLWTDRLEHALNTTKARSLDVPLGQEVRRFSLRDDSEKIACDSALRTQLKVMPQELLHTTIAEIERRLGVSLAAAAAPPEIYRPLEWTEVREMIQSGVVSIGSHTASHIILSRCSEARARAELTTSRDEIERHTGVRCTEFCYPNGRIGCFDSRTRDLVRESGYTCALTTVEGMNNRSSDVFELQRLSIVDGGHMDRFRLTLAGLMGPLDAVQNAGRRLAARARAGEMR
jgi:peptidoglycan/xylan/chitin deacetylase (PgdA/CDA1 family)